MRPVETPAQRGFTLVETRHESVLGRWQMVLALPRGPLADLVEAVWTSRGHVAFDAEEILPRSSTEVLFNLGAPHWLRDPADPSRDRTYERAFVSGLQRGPLHVVSPREAEMAGVRLRPAGAAAFLRDTPAAIAGAVVDLDAVLGAEVENLREQMALTPGLARRALLLAAAVARHLEGAPGPSAGVRHALHALHATKGRAAIADLAAETGYSHRWLTDRFAAEIGLTPKAYARLVRFEAAFARLAALERVDWAGFALDCGYYDQAHLAREFRAFAGTTPAEVHRRRAPDDLGLVAGSA